MGVPRLQRLSPGETFPVFHGSENRCGIDEYDVANQGLTSHHFEVVDGRLDRLSVPVRYAWPAELDLMAELAGMSLRERWSGWKREPFTSDSRKHVAVWEKPAVSKGVARWRFSVACNDAARRSRRNGSWPDGA